MRFAMRLQRKTQGRWLELRSTELLQVLFSARLFRFIEDVWGPVDLEERTTAVAGTVSKTGSRRVIPISENLAAWLEPFATRTGRICSSELRNRIEADRKRGRVGTEKLAR